MQTKKQNLAFALRFKELRERLGLDRRQFCEKFGGFLAYNTLKNIELGTQKPGKKILTALERLEKSGNSTTVSAEAAPVATRSARRGLRTVEVDDIGEAMLKLFNRLGIVRKAHIVAQLDAEVQGKNANASAAPPGEGCAPSAKAC